PPKYDAYRYLVESGSQFTPQDQYFTPWGTMIKFGDTNMPDGTTIADPTGVGDYSLNYNQCSPACCSDQWPVPFKVPVDKMLCGSREEYVPSIYHCNNGWQDSGCLCLTKKQNDFLVTRGLNADY